MKHVIDNRLFDTDKATLIESTGDSGLDSWGQFNDSAAYVEKLYRSPHGQYFMYARGGAESKYGGLVEDMHVLAGGTHWELIDNLYDWFIERFGEKGQEKWQDVISAPDYLDDVDSLPFTSNYKGPKCELDEAIEIASYSYGLNTPGWSALFRRGDGQYFNYMYDSYDEEYWLEKITDKEALKWLEENGDLDKYEQYFVIQEG